MSRLDIIRPGMFGKPAAADARRGEFDISNETFITQGIGIDFVFIGDSITQNWDTYAYFGNRGHVVVNRGISGDISGHVLRRFAADVVQLRPKYVVILIGINNFWALDRWVAEERETADSIANGIVMDVTEMVGLATEAGITPVLCSILPTDMVFSGFDAERNRGVVLANKQVEALCESGQGIYVDFHSAFSEAGEAKLVPGFADDGLHPHMLGYDRMADILRRTLSHRDISL